MCISMLESTAIVRYIFISCLLINQFECSLCNCIIGKSPAVYFLSRNNEPLAY